MGFCTSWAIDIHKAEHEWLEVVEVDLHLKKLGSNFHGRRIVHVSDLHYSRTVSSKYLKHCIGRINQLNADVVILTGDYITYDIYGRYRKKAASLIGKIESRYGSYACLGNHDYGVDGVCASLQRESLHRMIEDMAARGVNVLRNKSSVLEIDDQSLRFVGLGDLWADDFEPDKAFNGTCEDTAVIALAHNPEAVTHLEGFGFDAVMCGHTHGVRAQVARIFGRPFLNWHNYHAGLYEVGDKKVYVNRGLGRLGRPISNARPEITVFNLC